MISFTGAFKTKLRADNYFTGCDFSVSEIGNSTAINIF